MSSKRVRVGEIQVSGQATVTSEGGSETALKVFVSYSRKDMGVATRLVDALGSRAFNAFLDTKDIAPGEPWQERLGKLIEAADTIVFVLSPDSIASRICQWEADEAARLNKRILPVLWRPIDDASVPGHIRRLNYVKLTQERDFAVGFDELVRALLADINWIREHTRLGEAAGRWLAQGRRTDQLLRGGALADAELWISRRPREAPEPTNVHREFILASRNAETERAAAERAQLERERRLQRRWTWALTAVALLVAVGLIATMWQSRSTFEREARVLTTVAATALDQGRPDRALRLALAGLPAKGAIETLTPWSAELEAKLAEASRWNQVRRVIRSRRGSFDSLHISSDGLRAISVEQGRARIWDVATSTVVATLDGRHIALASARFSRDGSRVAVQSKASEVALYDCTTGHRLQAFDATTSPLLEMSPDGTSIATVDKTTVQLWDGRSGARSKSLVGLSQSITDVSFSDAGGHVAAGASDGRAAVWDVRTGDRVAMVTHLGMVNAPYPLSRVAISPDGSRLATASASFANILRLWDVARGAEVGQLHGHQTLMANVGFSADGRVLVSRDISGVIQLWTAATGRQLWLRQAQPGDGGLALSSDGRLIAIGSGKGDIEVRRADTGAVLGVLSSHDADVRTVAFTRDGHSLVTAGEDRAARTWDLTPMQPGATLRLATRKATTPLDVQLPPAMRPSAAVRAVDFRIDGAQVLLAGESSLPEVHAAGTGAMTKAFEGADGTPFDVRWSADGSKALMAAATKVWIWDVASGRLEAVLTGHDHFVRSASFNRDGTLALTASNDKTVRLWNATTGAELAVLARHRDAVTDAAFSPDEKRIATASLDKTIKIVAVADARELRNIDAGGAVRSVAFTRDGRAVAAAVGKDAVIWTVEDEAAPSTWLQGHSGPLRQVVTHPDGVTLVTASEDGSVRTWDLRSGSQLAVLRGFEGEVTRIAIEKSGALLAAASGSSVTIVALPRVPLRRGIALSEHACGSLLLDDGARAFTSAELTDPILRGRDDLANPCDRRGPLSFEYWTRLPEKFVQWASPKLP